MKDIVKEYWQLAVAIFAIVLAILVMCCSCSSVRQAEYITKTEYVHDTTKTTEYLHDTTKTTEVRIDSVDRIVEKTVYVDSNGVVHEREVERLTRYIYDLKDAYNSYEHVLQERIAELKEKLESKEETKIVEKKVYVWWPLWVAIGLIVAAVAAVVVFEKVMNKMAEAEGEQGLDR